MVRKGIVIECHREFKVVKHVEYDDKVFDDFYVRDVNASSKEGANILFAAHTFPAECEQEVTEALETLKAAKKHFDDTQASIFYKVFPQIKARAKKGS